MIASNHGVHFPADYPSVAPKEYNDGDKVDLKVNSLTSIKTHLPYDYYGLPFCTP